MSLKRQMIGKDLNRSSSVSANSSPIMTRIKIQIPKRCRKEPVISRLTSEHGLTVNITGAMLGAHSYEEGWFDLELHGLPLQVQSAIAYLQDLNVKIWGKPNPDGDGW